MRLEVGEVGAEEGRYGLNGEEEGGVDEGEAEGGGGGGFGRHGGGVVWCLVRVTRLVVCGAVAGLVFRCGRDSAAGEVWGWDYFGSFAILR